MPSIELKNVSKYYKIERRQEVALQDVNLKIEQGEFVFVVGSSGSGKSTLLEVLSGNKKPNRGNVYLGSSDLQSLRRWKKSRVTQTFGQVWQEPRLMRKRTVEENLEIAAMIKTWSDSAARRTVKKRVEKVLGLVGMQGVNHKYPVELSCGEARRVELARALINSPDILVLDEITNNLDDDNIWDIFHLLSELNQKGTTIIMATHASQYVNIMYRRVVTLVDGRIFGDVKRGKYGDVI